MTRKVLGSDNVTMNTSKALSLRMDAETQTESQLFNIGVVNHNFDPSELNFPEMTFGHRKFGMYYPRESKSIRWFVRALEYENPAFCFSRAEVLTCWDLMLKRQYHLMVQNIKILEGRDLTPKEYDLHHNQWNQLASLAHTVSWDATEQHMIKKKAKEINPNNQVRLAAKAAAREEKKERKALQTEKGNPWKTATSNAMSFGQQAGTKHSLSDPNVFSAGESAGAPLKKQKKTMEEFAKVLVAKKEKRLLKKEAQQAEAIAQSHEGSSMFMTGGNDALANTAISKTPIGLQPGGSKYTHGFDGPAFRTGGKAPGGQQVDDSSSSSDSEGGGVSLLEFPFPGDIAPVRGLGSAAVAQWSLGVSAAGPPGRTQESMQTGCDLGTGLADLHLRPKKWEYVHPPILPTQGQGPQRKRPKAPKDKGQQSSQRLPEPTEGVSER